MIKPNFDFLLAHPAHCIACGFGSGLSPIIPGTAGTLFGWLSFSLIRPYFSELEFGVFLVLAFVLGVFACDRTGRALGVADHGSIVWDEIVPFWVILLLAPVDWGWQFSAFLLFRFFDIVKPQPARWVDTHIKNGFGVMFDDVIAAGYTLLALALLKFVIG